MPLILPVRGNSQVFALLLQFHGSTLPPPSQWHSAVSDVAFCFNIPKPCRVWGSKVAPLTAWRGHLGGHQPLAAVVLFSSVASLLGSAGQASYSAANAALDAAASAGQHGGVAAVSMQWGAWAGGCMVGIGPA
jgi:hypothetical protein